MPLPDKSFFTLREVADRWGCTVTDVLRYGFDGLLTIRVWADFWKAEIGPFCDALDASKPKELDVVHGFYPLAPYLLERLRQRGRIKFKGDYFDVFVSEDGAETLVRRLTDETDKYTLDHLVVLRQECERFEKKYKITPHRKDGQEVEEVTRKAIMTMFPLDWENYFRRDEELKAAFIRKDGKKSLYDLKKVTRWLIKEGHYTPQEIDKILAKGKTSDSARNTDSPRNLWSSLKP
jgi:hypothetical protein